MKKIILVVALLLNNTAWAQSNAQIYTITYSGSSDNISIDIHLPKVQKGPVQLIIPRSAPGYYGVVFYDNYLSSIKGFDDNEKAVTVIRGEGPRWIIGDSSSSVLHINYEMDLKKMENEESVGASASKIRPNYVGLLGYSVFGYIEGFEEKKIQLHIKAPEGWPLFTTLSPIIPLDKTQMEIAVPNFDILADAQIMMGSALEVKRFDDGPVPLFVAQYAETHSSIDKWGKSAVLSMKLLKRYFGQIPFPYYTVYVEYLKPLDAKHTYNFGMEHTNSFTAVMDASIATTKIADSIFLKKGQPFILHHIAHAYIPLRCYGKGYKPFSWEMAPIINTIWFNEGFVVYITQQLLHTNMIPVFKKGIQDAPAFLKNISTQNLSELASTQYSSDKRIGNQNDYRGAMLANDLDDRIRQKTNNKKSLRDALLYLYNWSQREKRGFTIEEMPGIFRQATGVNVKAVFDKWMKPVSEIKTQPEY